MTTMTDSLVTLFRREFERDGARPFITWYGPDAARIELSLATLERWVAKTANFLQDGLAVEPGERVAVALPEHWLTPAIWFACWQNGLVVEPVDPDGHLPVDADVLFVEARRAGEATTLARDVIAVNTAPMGGRLPVGALTGGVADFGADVPGYDDRFAPYSPVDSDAPAVAFNGELTSSAAFAALGSSRDLPPGTRVLTSLPWHTRDGVLVLLAALAAGGGVVTGTTDPHTASVEHVTMTAGLALADLPRID